MPDLFLPHRQLLRDTSVFRVSRRERSSRASIYLSFLAAQCLPPAILAILVHQQPNASIFLGYPLRQGPFGMIMGGVRVRVRN